MKSEETTIYQDEETQIIDNKTPKTEGVEKKSNSGAWKRVVIGGVSGMVFGGASVFAANALSGEESGDEDVADGSSTGDNSYETAVSEDTHVTVDDAIPVAQVSDDMSFGEAFAAARAEVGAGGVFEWNGDVYNTYYAEEWGSMSAEEQAEFGSHVNYSGANGSTTNVAEDVVIEEEPVVVVAEVAEAEVEVVDVEEDYEVQIIGVSEETLDDGSTVMIGQVQVNGEDVFYIDTDGDGTFDVVAADLNHDGQIGEGEVADVQYAGITVDAFDPNMGVAQEDQYLASNDVPDYIGEDCNLV